MVHRNVLNVMRSFLNGIVLSVRRTSVPDVTIFFISQRRDRDINVIHSEQHHHYQLHSIQTHQNMSTDACSAMRRTQMYRVSSVRSHYARAVTLSCTSLPNARSTLVSRSAAMKVRASVSSVMKAVHKSSVRSVVRSCARRATPCCIDRPNEPHTHESTCNMT